MALELKPFDPADYLTNDETIAEYLRLALESNDRREIVQALGDVTRARGGIDKLAKEAGLEPRALQGALSDTGNPDLHTLVKILTALGIKLSVATTESVAA